MKREGGKEREKEGVSEIDRRGGRENERETGDRGRERRRENEIQKWVEKEETRERVKKKGGEILKRR